MEMLYIHLVSKMSAKIVTELMTFWRCILLELLISVGTHLQVFFAKKFGSDNR